MAEPHYLLVLVPHSVNSHQVFSASYLWQNTTDYCLLFTVYGLLITDYWY
jgi:hypothetical protein